MSGTRFFYLTIVAMAFTILIGFGIPKYSLAIPSEAGNPPGTCNAFGDDKATNTIQIIDRDKGVDLNECEQAGSSGEPKDNIKKKR